jgi:hypothetical protein
VNSDLPVNTAWDIGVDDAMAIWCFQVYFMFLRPVLHAIPALKGFYAEANTFWGKVWALTGRSVTVLWACS